MLAGGIEHLHHLCFRHLIGVDATYTHALLMNMKHHLGGLFLIHPENLHQHQHHKFHGRVIIIEQEHLIHRWLLSPRARPRDDASFLILVLIKIVGQVAILKKLEPTGSQVERAELVCKGDYPAAVRSEVPIAKARATHH